MSSGPLESKRPRLSEPSSSSWSAGTPHGGVSLPHPTPSGPPPPCSLPPSSQHPAPVQYQAHYPPPTSDSHPPPPPPPSAPPQPPPLRPPPPPQHTDGRRHHEQEPPYGVMQDYRPPPSPAHAHPPQGAPGPPGPSGPPGPFHGSFPVRDTAIKRDSSADDAMSIPRRPPSTGNVPDGLPMTVSGPHQPPPAQVYHDDGRRHMSFDAGPPSMPPTPGGYRQPNYPPPTPITHHQPYEPMGYPPSEPPYYANVYSSTAKRKATRASQACDSCRSLKAKCDETKPCKNCREKNMECKYRDPIPKASGDKAQADILDGVQIIQKTLLEYRPAISSLTDRVGKLERLLVQINPQLDLKLEEMTTEHVMKAARGATQSPLETTHDETYHGSPMTYDVPDEELEANPGPPVAPGEPSIPINHTTGAGHLLSWPSIHRLVEEYLERERIKFPAEYPIRQEEARGLLRVYGRGEGRDTGSPDRDGYGDHGVLELDDANYSDMSSPSPAGEYWGHVGGFSPVNPVEYTTSNPKPPVLNPSGIPDFSPEKVNLYMQSFQDNILNMHPIIHVKDLRAMVRMFQDSIPKPPTKPPNPVSTANFVHSATPVGLETVGSKRKRSPAAEEPATPILQHRAGRPTRTINNAVVLTMLALGKICLHRDGIPDVVHETSDSHGHSSSPVIRNGHPTSPGHTSPPDSFGANSLSSGLPSPKEHEKTHGGRRPSLSGGAPGRTQRRNYDNIPGLAYFAIASDVIGNQMGGTTMNHVYANIFAGLFHGQLGRVIESHAYIAHACTVLMNIMRPSMNRLREMKEANSCPVKPRDNQLVFAFWTCLQLESDIVAELPRHQSGILAQEDNIPYPSMELWQSEQRGREGGLEDPVIESYMAQLYLRKHLNMIHRMFYSGDPSAVLQGREAFAQVSDAQARVANMAWCSANFKFSEDDKPADDILAARLRAKYWGAQVITYRPFIRQILDFSHRVRTNHLTPTAALSEFREDIRAPRIPSDARDLGDVSREVIDYARMGIRALVESTQAFHGLTGGRPIITNVFGTAHAQWGNLLVLAACYKDPMLQEHVNEDQLRDLFNKTIMFFRKIAAPTSALAKDKRILEGLRRSLFESNHIHPNTSFSSTTSTPMQGHPMMATGPGTVPDPEPMSATTPISGDTILPPHHNPHHNPHQHMMM